MILLKKQQQLKNNKLSSTQSTAAFSENKKSHVDNYKACSGYSSKLFIPIAFLKEIHRELHIETKTKFSASYIQTCLPRHIRSFSANWKSLRLKSIKLYSS